MVEVDKVVVGVYAANCYILSKNNKALVIDPGDEYDKIKPFINNKEIVGVLITHKHPDHIGALNNFDKNKIYSYNNLKEGINQITPFTFEVIYTKGHTSDSITFYFQEDNLMFTGDFLFKGSIGRMDLPTGNANEMIKSIEKLKKYPNVKIFPGHGEPTTLEEEKQNNIYFSLNGWYN